MLKFTVDGQKLELLGDPHVVADSFDFLTGSFKFYSGHDWELTEKHVFFQIGTGTPYEVTLTDDEFVKADHVNLTTGTWSIYVIGYDIDGATLVERITTNKVSLTAQISGVPEGEPFPPSIIPDVLIVKDQTVPQTFINGVPKLAADRVISDDHHIVDKKHVEDTTLQLDQTAPQTLTAPPLLDPDRVIDSAEQIVDKKYVDQYALGGSGFAANLYFTTIASNVAGYKKIAYIAEAAETELTIPTTTTEVLARTYLYDDGLGVTVIDGGKWSATYRAKASGAQGVTLRLVAFLRHTDNTETTLFSASSDKIINTAYATLEFQITQPSFNCLATDRLGFKLYASTTHPAGITLYTIVGDGNASYVNTPIALRHSQLRDLNGDLEVQHMTAAEKTKLTGIDVSGAISTHNSDAGAHAVLARKTETMRLLISRTIGAGENVSAITWTQDDAGNALALIEEEIKIYIPSNTIGVGVNGDVYLRLNDKAGASDYHIGGTRASSVMRCAIYKTLYGKAYTRIGLFGGFPMASHGYAADDGTTLSQSVLTQGGNFQVSSINKIYVYIGTLTYFPAGTVIEIYGRTA